METVRTLPWVAWYLKIGSREHPEWMEQDDENIHFMQIAFRLGKKKKASLTSSREYLPSHLF